MKRTHSKGFTLIEATITLAVIALISAVVVPSLNNVTMAELRKASRMFAGLVRTTYDMAALTGQTYRIVFNIETRTVSVENSSQTLRLEPGGNSLAAASAASGELGGGLQTILDGARAGAGGSGEEGEEALNPMGALLNMGSLLDTDGANQFQPAGDPVKLDEQIKILNVWVHGDDKPIAEGIAYLYFFPHGYTQDALIRFEDSSARVFTVRVSALTGKVAVFNRYVEENR